MARIITLAIGVIAAIAVTGAAAVLVLETAAMLAGGYEGYAERSERIPPVRQAVVALLPLGIVVFAPRWARILLTVAGDRPWITVVNWVLTVVSVVGTLAGMVVFGLSFDVISELFEGSSAGALLLSCGLASVLWTLLAPFLHLIGLWPRYLDPDTELTFDAQRERVTEAWIALIGGDVLRALSFSMPVMIAFWVISSDIGAAGRRMDLERGIVAAGIGGWMLGLLALQLLLLAVLATVFRRRVGGEGFIVLAVSLTIVVGVIDVLDAVLTGQIGLFHVIALVPVIPGTVLALWVRHRRLQEERGVRDGRNRSAAGPANHGG